MPAFAAMLRCIAQPFMSPLLMAVLIIAISLYMVILFGPSAMPGIMPLTFCMSAPLQLIFAAEAGVAAIPIAPNASNPIIAFVMSFLPLPPAIRDRRRELCGVRILLTSGARCRGEGTKLKFASEISGGLSVQNALL